MEGSGRRPDTSHNFRLQFLSECPASLGSWANSGERCAWSQIIDSFRTLPEAEWYALGDDTTLWDPQNLQQVVSVFPPKSRVFLGATGSEDNSQRATSFNPGDSTFEDSGRAGVVLSHAVMEELQTGLAECFLYLRHVQESNKRISLCIETLSNTIVQGLSATGV